MEPKVIISIALMVTALAVSIFMLCRENRRARRAAGITSYSTMPLGVYLDVLKLAEDKEPEDALPEIMALLTCRPLSEILAMTLPEYSAVAARFRWLETDPEPVPVRRAYDCGPFRLTVTKNVAGLTASQFIDTQTILEDPADRLADILAVIMVPAGHAYADGYEIADVKEAILKHLSVLDAVAVRDFFEDCSKRLMQRFLSSSGIMIKMLMKRAKKDPKAAADLKKLQESLKTLKTVKAGLDKNGDGSRRSTTCLSLPVALGRLHLKCL